MLRTGNISRGISEQQQAAKYQDWWEDMQSFAATHDNISGLTQLVSMWNPIVGFGLDTINRSYQKHNMPDEFESNYLYTSMNKDREYHEGSKDSLLELEAGMWSSLMGHLGKSAQLHGISGFQDAFGDIGKFGGNLLDKIPNPGDFIPNPGDLLPDRPNRPTFPKLPRPDWFPDMWPPHLRNPGEQY